MNRLNFKIALYEIFQMVLIDKDVLDKNGYPPEGRKLKKMSFEEQEAVYLYKWIGESIKGSKTKNFIEAKDEFNKYAKNMHDEVYLNMFMMALFMFDSFIQDEPKMTKILLESKIKRIMEYMRSKILEVEKRGAEILTDSSMAASNIYRGYNKKAELTREVREARLNQWREASRKMRKTKEKDKEK